MAANLTFRHGGTDSDTPSVAHIDEKTLLSPGYRGSWLRGNQLPQNHPGYCTQLPDPYVKFWVANPGSEYSRDHGHRRIVPAHDGARNEYVYCLVGQLDWVDNSLRKDCLTFGTGPVKLGPWDQGQWVLPRNKPLAMGVTLTFAEPIETHRIGHGPRHEFHLLGLPDQIISDRIAQPDHYPKQYWAAMLLMVFRGSVDVVIPEGFRGALTAGSVVYYPSQRHFPSRPVFGDFSNNFRGAVLFYSRPDPSYGT